MRRLITALTAIFLLIAPALAMGYEASLEASASKSEVAKGEGFTYKLSIIQEGQADRVAQPVPPDFTGFDVTVSSASTSVKVINNKARTVTDQEYGLSSEIPGEHTIPPGKLMLTDPKTGKVQEMASNPVKVVVSEKGQGMVRGMEEEIRDIRAPRGIMDRVRLFFYGLVAFVVLIFFLILGLAVYMVKRKGKVKAQPTASAPGAPALAARDEALAELKRAEALKGDAKAFYSAVSQAVRGYLKAAKGIPATEATTSEIMAEARKAGLPYEVQERLRELFEEADLVKFAKLVPDDAGKVRSLDVAIRMVREI